MKESFTGKVIAVNKGIIDQDAGSAVSDTLKNRLWVAIHHVYAHKGFNATSVELILREANISRPTFYKVYKSKAEALIAILDVTCKDLEERFDNTIKKSDATFQERGDSFLEDYIKWGLKYGSVASRFISETELPSCPVSYLQNRIFAQAKHALITIFKDNDQDISIHPDLLYVYLQAIIRLCLPLFHDPRSHSHEDINNYRQQIRKILYQAIGSIPKHVDSAGSTSLFRTVRNQNDQTTERTMSVF